MDRSLRSLGLASAISVAALVALTLAPAALRAAMEADEAHHDHRAVGGRRVDRPGHARHRGGNRKGARPEGHRRQSARRVRLDRHEERARSPKDGYTWTAGAAQDLGTYAVLGMLDTKIGDWASFLNVANVSTLSVNPSTPYKTPDELIDAMKAKPGAISVATAGVNSSGHSAMEAIAKATGVKYKHVTYDGGNPAVVSTVAGETDVTSQLTVEQAEMIRGKKLRALAVIGDKPVEIDGYGVIEPLTKTLPGFKAPANYFGIFIPKGVPPEVIATVEKIWTDQIVNSATLKQYATSRGAQFAPYAGADAQKAVFPAVQANAWAAADTGKAKVSPDTLGIPRP
jgi:tripartite-type tricarboxylate transporter receptor subunit TctC